MSIQEEYKYFMENCTSSPKSYKNYSDFGRICKTVAEIRQRAEFDIYSITEVRALEELIGELETNTDFQSYNKKGGNQYSNALSFYLRFLKAREFFKSPQITQKRKEYQIHSLQQIYYGAPGTGKSYEIDKITKEYDTIRTTFHPDSDYSTFVGAYKPTMTKVELRDVSGHVVKEGNDIVKEDRITYKFVKQAFLKAYLAAWKKYAEGSEDGVAPQFLVIEEINRGNCAQIFGDLFQLLDRQDNGFSSYPIEADADLQREIADAFAEKDGEYQLSANGLELDGVVNKYNGNLADDIKSGRILLLPSNLFIWATMNTSDQSLFPIDSAFKRRWDWHYVKIAKGKDKDTGKDLEYKIRCGDETCDWWTFISAMNEKIATETSSDDKKLGYFFCKPTNGDNLISEKRFVGKVMFYLWNDVFKDGDTKDFNVCDDPNKTATFEAFYNDDNSVNVENVRKFLVNIVGEENLHPIVDGGDEDKLEDENEETSDDGKDFTKYSINGEGRFSKRRIAVGLITTYVEKIRT